MKLILQPSCSELHLGFFIRTVMKCKMKLMPSLLPRISPSFLLSRRFSSWSATGHLTKLRMPELHAHHERDRLFADTSAACSGSVSQDWFRGHNSSFGLDDFAPLGTNMLPSHGEPAELTASSAQTFQCVIGPSQALPRNTFAIQQLQRY